MALAWRENANVEKGIGRANFSVGGIKAVKLPKVNKAHAAKNTGMTSKGDK